MSIVKGVGKRMAYVPCHTLPGQEQAAGGCKSVKSYSSRERVRKQQQPLLSCRGRLWASHTFAFQSSDQLCEVGHYHNPVLQMMKPRPEGNSAVRKLEPGGRSGGPGTDIRRLENSRRCELGTRAVGTGESADGKKCWSGHNGTREGLSRPTLVVSCLFGVEMFVMKVLCDG